jgi:hypothetical protein
MSIAHVPAWLNSKADVMIEAGQKERALLAVRDEREENPQSA